MSSMLEQAIIDAKDLREAAMKSAENEVLERYNIEVKEAVEQMLEQELSEAFEDEVLDDPVVPGEELGLEPEDTLAPPTGPAVPFAATEDESACPCPEKDESVSMELEFTLDELKTLSEEMDAEGLLDEDEKIEEILDEEVALDEEVTLDEEADLDEEIDLDEGTISELVEELVCDLSGAELTGWAGRPESDRYYAQQIRLANLASTEAQVELAAIKQGIAALAEDKKNLKNSNKKLKEAIYYLKNKLEEVNFSNAKLLYVNRTLNSASLNERQKKKVVGSIQNADSIDEAKVIFETLQSTMGVAKSAPKSLSEAINKSSKTIPSQKKESPARSGVLKERFQRLAGIK